MNKNLRTALIVGGIVLAALAALPLFRGDYVWQGGGWGMMGPGMMGGFGGGWWMAILMILVPVLVIWVVVALARGDTWFDGPRHTEHAESAMELLKKRYARGEISKEEFEEKRRTLA